MSSGWPRISLLLVLLGVGVGIGPASAVPFFQGIGDLPGGGFDSRAYGISGDGTVAVGEGSAGPPAGRDAVRYENGTLSSLGGFGSTAVDASYDGSVIVGSGRRWENGTETTLLGPNGSPVLTSDAVSADGAVVVGSLGGGAGYRWEGGTAVDIGLPAGKTRVENLRVSGDGSILALTGAAGLDDDMAYLLEAGVFTPLGVTPGGTQSRVGAISADGRVVVGESRGSFRWEGGVMQRIALANPVGVSADGSVIVGTFSLKPAVWMGGQTAVLEDVLQSAGLDLTGWTLDDVWGVSDDGLTFVGTGTNPDGHSEGWIAHVDALVVPEPISAALVGLGLAGLGLARRRQPPGA